MSKYIVVKTVTMVETEVYEADAENEHDAISATTASYAKPVSRDTSREPKFIVMRKEG